MLAAPYADTDAIFRKGLEEVMRPRERLTLDKWCDKYRVLPVTGTGAARSGPWDTDNTPYLREPLRRLHDTELKEVAFWKSSQVGYTEGIAVNFVLHCIAELRRPVKIVYPTATKGIEYNRDRLMPGIHACEQTSRMIRRSNDLTQEEVRIGGVPIKFGYSASRDSLRGDPIGYIIPDEIDAFDNSSNDTLEQCRSRQTTFADRKLIKGSTPESEDGIIKEYTTADVQWRFMVPCPFTGQFFELFFFDQLCWHGGTDADPVVVLNNTWVESPFSTANKPLRIREHCKRWMVRNGIWVTQDETIESDRAILATLDRENGSLLGLGPIGIEHEYFDDIGKLTSDFFRDADQEPDRHRRNAGLDAAAADAIRGRLGVRIVGTRNRGPNHGYRINSLCSVIDAGGWGKTTSDFVRARGSPDPTWSKERLGRVPSAASERLEITQVKSLCLGSARGGHEFGECPEWAVATFGGIDVQKNCIKGSIWAFGPEAIDAALCRTFEIPRDVNKELREPELRDAVRDMALRLSGSVRTVRPKGWFIDSGYEAEAVYAFVRYLRSQRVRAYACKGTDRDGNGRAIWPSYVTERNLPDGRREKRPDPIDLIHFADDWLSARLVSRLSAAPDAIDEETGELLIDEADLVGRVVLPGLDGWPDAEAVIAESTNIHRVQIGQGSGKSGKDGRGRLRKVWRKMHKHRANDYFDTHKLAWIGPKRFQLDRWTEDALRQTAEPTTGRRARGEMKLS